MDMFTNPTFIAVIVGFVILYVYQVSFKGPKEADRQNRIDEYMGRLSDDAKHRIESLLEGGDKLGAIKLFREEANVGLVEAKEAINFMKKHLKKN